MVRLEKTSPYAQRSGDNINLAAPLLAVPSIFQEDELYFELFCDYYTKTCVIAIIFFSI